MKKSYLMIAVVALALTACSENEKITGEEGQSIQFAEFVNKATKAEIANEQALAQAGGFKVWGYKNLITKGSDWSSRTPIFGGTVVTGTNAADPVWSYSPIKYWDKTCNYIFYAAGPATGMDGTLECVASGDAAMKFTVTGAKSAIATSSTSDFVIDRVVNKTNAKTDLTSTYKVQFDFHHIMAKISFALKKSPSLASSDVLIVNSMKMTAYNGADGNFTQKKFDGTWETLDVSEWTQASTASGDTQNLIDSDMTLTTTATALTGKDFIMVPQAIAAETLKFTLTYTLNNEIFQDQEATLSAAQTWGTDSHVTYTITVGPQAILFDVLSVCGFDVIASGDVSVN